VREPWFLAGTQDQWSKSSTVLSELNDRSQVNGERGMGACVQRNGVEGGALALG
jgi:hypothetical protein